MKFKKEIIQPAQSQDERGGRSLGQDGAEAHGHTELCHLSLACPGAPAAQFS